MTATERTQQTQQLPDITVRWLRASVYEVPSQTGGAPHEFDLTTRRCSCKAGQSGRHCWAWGAAAEAHQFRMNWMRRMEQTPPARIVIPADGPARLPLLPGVTTLQDLFD